MSEGKSVDYVELLKANNPNITSWVELSEAGIPNNQIPPGTGLFNSPINRSAFSYNTPLGARQLENQGAFIVFGQVPNAGNASGYGGRGLPAESIDLVVGRHASSNGGLGPKLNASIDNNFATDAARIYISRICDIDEVFGLASSDREGKGLVGRSGIGIKADGVRIIGREGVKITTGRMKDAKFGLDGETNSLGGKTNHQPKIQLIAGNNTDNLQGVALGENVRNCLFEMVSIMEMMWGCSYNSSKINMEFSSVLGISPLPHVAASGPWAALRQGLNVMAPLYHTRVNLLLSVVQNYLAPYGPDYIVSRNVETN